MSSCNQQRQPALKTGGLGLKTGIMSPKSLTDGGAYPKNLYLISTNLQRARYSQLTAECSLLKK